ncbi:MAG: lipopolysaccharide biosynthesis protein [Candidatus Brocadiaceae bacterium]|nr:lipopolysaccharide biosynthesis protein [Candidatus Brocadiaceae bacterium]
MKITDKNVGTKTQLYWNTLIRIPSQGICFVFSILTARILIPEDFGILGIAMMVIGYANIITNFGLNEAIIQKRVTDKKVLNSIFTFDFGISATLVIIFYFLAGYAAIFFNVPECKDVIKVASAVFIITAFSGIPRSILKRDMDFKTISIMDTIQAIACSSLTLVLAMYHLNYWALVYGQIIPMFLITMILCIRAKWMPLFQYDSSSMKEIYNFGIWNFLKTQLQYFTAQIDKLIIGRFMGTVSLGLYDRAMSIAKMPLKSLTMNINAVMFSSFSEYQDKIAELQNKFKKSLTLISIMNIPIFVGLIVIAPYFVHVLLGDKWGPMITPFQIILFACIFGSFGGLVASLNVAMGNYKTHTLLCFLSSVFFVACCFLLLRFGLCGISVSFLAYYAIVHALTLYLAMSKVAVSLKEIVYAVLPGFLGSSIMYSTLKMLSLYYLPDYSFKNMVVLVISGIVIYMLYMFIEKSKSTRVIKSNIIADISHRFSVFFNRRGYHV